MIDAAFFSDLCQRELELCELRSDETLAVLSYAGASVDYADAFLAAATRLGATAYQVRIPRVDGERRGIPGEGAFNGTRVTGLATNAAAEAALAGADMIIDNVGLLFSAEQRRLLDGGARILTCTQPIDHLVRLFPNKAMRARVEEAVARLAKSTHLRVTSPGGTDVSYQLGTYPSFGQYGYTATPGRWDHWPSGGFVYSGASDDGVDGTVVLSPGDIVFPLRRYVAEPVTITIEAGRIVSVQGGVDAQLLTSFLESFADPRGFGISHIGWGLDERAQWWAQAADDRGIGMEARTYAGNVLFSTGPNSELGGTNDTACHTDIPLHGCSLYLDDEAIVLDGRVVDIAAPSRADALSWPSTPT